MRHIKIETLTLFIALLMSAQGLLLAQTKVTDVAVMADLEAQLAVGNKRALRDMGSFLDRPHLSDAARRALAQYTFFIPSEIDLARCDRTTFFNFYYDNEKLFKFSEIIGGFYLTPIEFQPYDTAQFAPTPFTPPSVSLRNLASKFTQMAQNREEPDSLVTLIQQIAQLEAPERFDWLRQTLRAQLVNRGKTEVNVAICDALSGEPSEDNLTTVIWAVEKGIVSKDLLSSVFLAFTNFTVSLPQTRQMLDSFTSLEALRTYGYSTNLPFNETFFYEKVDFYGKVLSYAEAPHWLQRSALYDLMTTQNPRLLFFLAAQTRLKPESAEFYKSLIEKLTHIHLPIEGRGWQARKELKTIENEKNYIRWWAIHAEDFEWSDADHRFANRTEIAKRTEELERLIRRLASSNDSVAVAAFVALTEGEPTAVAATAEKFRPLLLSYNRRLPDVSYPFLEQMTVFSAFCRQQSISLKLPSHADSILKKLVQTTDAPARYALENKLIETLTIDELSAIEFYGLLYSTDVALNFSISRILDIFYAKNWQQVIADRNHIRLYAKKAALFQRIGVSGVCNLYDKRFDKIDRRLRSNLEEIATIEGDNDIRVYLRKWLDTEGGNETRPALSKDIVRVDTTTFDVDLRLRELLKEATLTIEEINQVVSVSNFPITHKPLVIKLLRRVYPLSSIRSFKLKNWLSAKTDLSQFADLEIAPKDLDDVVRIFNVDEPSVMWRFINERLQNFTPSESGNFWNTLFKITWFTELIYSENLGLEQRDTIVKSLRTYLTDNGNLSEFEEQTTLLHITELENIGLKLHQKLESALNLDAQEGMKAAVQASILARIRYDEIAVVAPYLPRLSAKSDGTSSLSFLQTDFGIPIQSDNKEAIDELIEKHKTLSAKQFYEYYLKKFGVSIRTPEGLLDFNKIHDLLTFDIVVPFTGGGAQRDYCTYSLIKFLEFEFATSLGFHEKLNENQTFYVYNAAKRAKAWRNYLKQKKFVRTYPSVSFND
jgi:hypothetical protein